MDPILERRLAGLGNYVSPEDFLHEIKQSVIPVLQHPQTETLRRTREQGALLEKHQAGFLAFMVKHMAGQFAEVTLCLKSVDDEDFDCVIKAVTGNGTVYTPVQLKELPSHGVSPDIELQALIDKLKEKYRASPDLVVAIWINRDIDFDLSKLKFDGLTIGQLWFFGDSTSGEITLDGSVISDLTSGVCWSGFMRNGRPQGGPRRFKPSAGDGR